MTDLLQSYPTKWSLVVPGAELELQCVATMVDQEVMTLISSPGFWEGRLQITGTHKGKPVKGVGFLERHGFDNMHNLDAFFNVRRRDRSRELS